MYAAHWFQDEFAAWRLQDMPFGISMFTGLLNALFGCAGGWILWRFGIRPAVTPLTDAAGVFE